MCMHVRVECLSFFFMCNKVTEDGNEHRHCLESLQISFDECHYSTKTGNFSLIRCLEVS